DGAAAQFHHPQGVPAGDRVAGPVDDPARPRDRPAMRLAMTVERLIARVLLLGGLLSVSLMLSGLVVYAVRSHPEAREIVRVVRNREAGRAVDVFTSAGDVRRALAQRPPDPLAVSALGLVCLMVTPVLGVAAAVTAFWRAGDRDYTTMACVVLILLLLSFGLAAAG